MRSSRVLALLIKVGFFVLALTAAAFTQTVSAPAPADEHFDPGTTIPIIFTSTIDASKARPGELVRARTSGNVVLRSGEILPRGSMILGHVVEAKSSGAGGDAKHVLALVFDSVLAGQRRLDLHVVIRAIADPAASEAARSPEDSDLDPLARTTQVGGDTLTPSQQEIRTANSQVAGRQNRSGMYARLIANRRGNFSCGATLTEQAVGRFSADACGLYGFPGVEIDQQNSPQGNLILLSSSNTSPTIWIRSTALLQVSK